jgi:GR25 family glycosyltransferase involved in LPS biosynthesis
MNINKIPIFIITLLESNERRSRLTARLKFHNIYDNSRFVYGFKSDSPVIDWLGYGSNATPVEYATLYSHIFAIRNFVDSNSEIGLILEDDVVFKNDFCVQINNILQNIKIHNLFLLTCLKFDSVKCEPGIYEITRNTYGAQGYLITREYALNVLQNCDKPGFNITTGRLTSEIITMNSKGLYMIPPLVIEECYSSVMNHNVSKHLEAFKRICNLKDYCICENELILKSWNLI